MPRSRLGFCIPGYGVAKKEAVRDFCIPWHRAAKKGAGDFRRHPFDVTYPTYLQLMRYTPPRSVGSVVTFGYKLMCFNSLLFRSRLQIYTF